MKNLLIGNGLNLTNFKENSFLSTSEIGERFKENLEVYWSIINKLVYQNNMNLNKLLRKLDLQDGIEILAGKAFKFIYEEITLKQEFNWNYCYRLIEILGEISIKSIFFKDNKFMIPKINEEYKNAIEKNYDNIFSLNYIEDWDTKGRINYLHGNLKKYIQNYCDIGSSILSNNKDYIDFKKEEYKKINFLDIVFVPTNTIANKYNYIEEGLYPNKCNLTLYPADDLFPYEGRDMYSELNNLENIEIFGMSPYGDEAIINKIKNIRNIKIYVHKLNQDEINKWKSYGINNCFMDSSKFIEVNNKI